MKIAQIINPAVIAGLLGFFALSCTGSFSRINNSTTANANDSQPNIIYSEIIFPENSDYLLIPVGFDREDQKKSGSILPSTEIYRGSESVRKNPMTVYNLIFHHQQTGSSHLLLAENSVISSFSFIDEEITEPNAEPNAEQNSEQTVTKNKLILLEIISADTNGDEKINLDDAIVAYLADAAGKNVTQITPDNTKVVSWHLDREGGFILLKVMQDSDQDREFTPEDDTSFIRVQLNDLKIGSDIITAPMRKQINQRL